MAMHKQEIMKLLQTYLETENVTITQIERFLGGMSNFTYHVVANEVHYVVRIASKEGKVFVNYPSEKLHLFLVEPYNITSKTLYYDTKTGNKITEYIHGNNLASEINDKDIKAIAGLLQKIHALPLTGLDYDHISRLSRYEALIHEKLSEEYNELKGHWITEKETTYKNVTQVFTHGDAQRSNLILDDKGDYYILDFEFSGQNDPFYDIASFGNINFSDTLILLDYYLGRKATDSEKRRMYFNRMYQVLQWHLVAYYKDEIGLSEKLHIDFKTYSAKYLAFARYLYEEIKKLAS